MPDGYAFSHDPERCIKCYTCELACKQWKGIAAGTFKLRRVFETTAGTFPQVTRTFHSVACQHCPDAPCIAACPPGLSASVPTASWWWRPPSATAAACAWRPAPSPPPPSTWTACCSYATCVRTAWPMARVRYAATSAPPAR